MKYWNNEFWRRLPLTDYRARFFIEVYREKLHMQTPHFKQARLMNIFSSSREALDYIAEQRNNEKNAGYLHLALDEIENCLRVDFLAKEMFASHKPILDDLIKDLRSGSAGENKLQRFQIIAEHILQRRAEYENQLLVQLRDAVVGDRDLGKKARVLDDIYTLTGLYITNLLDRGYSPTYLYNRAEMFTRPTSYGSKTFSEQFDSVTNKLKSRDDIYRVHFALQTNKMDSLFQLAEISDCNIRKGIPDEVYGKQLEKVRIDFSPKLFATLEVNSTDYVRAAWLGKEVLNQFVEFASALEVNPQIKVASHCVVVWESDRATHKKALNIDLLTRLMVSEAGTYLPHSKATLYNVFERLEDSSRQSLMRSLRYLRIGRDSVSIEQKLLNLWIAFESLFENGSQGLVQIINDVIPQIYAVIALRRRLSYLRELLGANSIPVPSGACEGYMGTDKEFSLSVDDEQVFRLIRDDQAAKELFNSLGDREHLKYTLKETTETFRENRSIKRRIERSEADVARQIKRIYYLRNKIAHTGHYSNIRPALVTHLVDYLVSCYIAIDRSAEGKAGNDDVSIAACLQAYKMGAESVVHRCEAQEEIDSIADITATPVI
ncbi:HEPN domain-containing protein [Vreelandella utahensis]|uniref:HEPN domain-containing protein n=1 Tax=Vreelandella halophila TaxID=86177 RepID=UPI00117B08C1|nr:HEPN domain-containing protein [Halomonas utahensis]